MRGGVCGVFRTDSRGVWRRRQRMGRSLYGMITRDLLVAFGIEAKAGKVDEVGGWWEGLRRLGPQVVLGQGGRRCR